MTPRLLWTATLVSRSGTRRPAAVVEDIYQGRTVRSLVYRSSGRGGGSDEGDWLPWCGFFGLPLWMIKHPEHGKAKARAQYACIRRWLQEQDSGAWPDAPCATPEQAATVNDAISRVAPEVLDERADQFMRWVNGEAA